MSRKFGPVVRHWCARCQYPGRTEFLLGTVQAEGAEQARAELLRLWGEITPHPAPPRFDPIPGELVFRDE